MIIDVYVVVQKMLIYSLLNRILSRVVFLNTCRYAYAFGRFLFKYNFSGPYPPSILTSIQVLSVKHADTIFQQIGRSNQAFGLRDISQR